MNVKCEAGTTLSVSYIGRRARSLLARRDAMAFNDIRDPKSGMDWYTAGTILEKQRQQDVPTSQIASIPFFDNLFPANLVTLFNNDPNIQAGFPSNWTPTQVFYGLQSEVAADIPQPIRVFLLAMIGRMRKPKLILHFSTLGFRPGSCSRNTVRWLHGARLEIPTTMLSRSRCASA